ncbi:hypothetical protein KSP40_PGU016374 [Platanthera guangdongensis]|uniref:Uncharacterized protein n=1 Tax=Platanthera guangdongensis TaxID=2320717 RepID=A0ABR2LMT6_9ASPA
MATSGGGELWWWAASSGQLAAGVALYRRGRGGSGAAMPFMAFAISTLIIGAGAAAGVGALHSSGIHTFDLTSPTNWGILKLQGETANERLHFFGGRRLQLSKIGVQPLGFLSVSDMIHFFELLVMTPTSHFEQHTSSIMMLKKEN